MKSSALGSATSMVLKGSYLSDGRTQAVQKDPDVRAPLPVLQTFIDDLGADFCSRSLSIQ